MKTRPRGPSTGFPYSTPRAPLALSPETMPRLRSRLDALESARPFTPPLFPPGRLGFILTDEDAEREAAWRAALPPEESARLDAFERGGGYVGVDFRAKPSKGVCLRGRG